MEERRAPFYIAVDKGFFAGEKPDLNALVVERFIPDGSRVRGEPAS